MEVTDSISLDCVGLSLGGRKIISDFNLRVREGSFVCLLAPSGAGKTTLLRIVAGLQAPSEGTLVVRSSGGKRDARIGFMFQENSIFPWLSARDNITFGMQLKRNREIAESMESAASVDKLGRELGIEDQLDLFPRQLSGGQKQRVVIARSLILEPSILLCDEPFSALDELTRRELREQLLDVQSRHSPTILFITHSVEEAVFLGERVVVCSGPPLRIESDFEVTFKHPRDRRLLEKPEFFDAMQKVRRVLERPRKDSAEREGCQALG
jgi:NitT/TauT family transport system ATP-binding protein